jgi:pimeloyl-ACP methyl ester carboxylesterase
VRRRTVATKIAGTRQALSRSRLWAMPYASVNGARLYYEQHGGGPDLVFAHGAGGNHLVWWRQLPVFAREFRCTVYDARGWGISHGDMAAGRWAFGTDLIGLLDHLGIERAHFVAHSMAGRAMAGIVRLSPERIRSMVLSGTNGGVANDRIRAIQDELRDLRGEGGLREHALSDAFEAREPELALLYRQFNALNRPRPKGMLGRPPPTYKGSMHEPITNAGAPVLFIVGEHDLITSPELIREAATLVPGSRIHEVRDAGHSAYFEQPEDWNAVVLGFLRGVERADSGK